MDIKLNTNKRNIIVPVLNSSWEKRCNTEVITRSGGKNFLSLKNLFNLEIPARNQILLQLWLSYQILTQNITSPEEKMIEKSQKFHL